MGVIKSNALDCARCGCNATVIVGAGEKHGKPWARYECTYCGKQFIHGTEPKQGENELVEYQKTRCPKCNSINTRVTGSPLPIRYHHCDNCNKPFRSFEKK